MEVAEIFHTSAIRSPSFFALRGICKGILTSLFAQAIVHFSLFFAIVYYLSFDFLKKNILHRGMANLMALSTWGF